MSEDTWEDFCNLSDRRTNSDSKQHGAPEQRGLKRAAATSVDKSSQEHSEHDSDSDSDTGWGSRYQKRPPMAYRARKDKDTDSDCDEERDDDIAEGSYVNKFATVYERYLDNKSYLESLETKNVAFYRSNPHKALREWFDNNGHEFDIKTERMGDSEVVCVLGLPVEEQEFTLTSEVHSRRQACIDEICMAACRMLDQCELLCAWAADHEAEWARRRRINAANKEDDIELDESGRRTGPPEAASSASGGSKPGAAAVAATGASRKAETHESLMCAARCEPAGPTAAAAADDDADEEPDPLDAFMAELERPAARSHKATMDEKIEKSRIKAQIAADERQLEQLGRLIALARPQFDLERAVGRK